MRAIGAALLTRRAATLVGTAAAAGTAVTGSILMTGQTPTPEGDWQYVQDIRIEATRTAELNDRTEAVLAKTEPLADTALESYVALRAFTDEISAETSRILADIEFLKEHPYISKETADSLQVTTGRLASEIGSAIQRIENQRIDGNAEIATNLRALQDQIEAAQELARTLDPEPVGENACNTVLSVENLTRTTGIGPTLAGRIRIDNGC